MSTPTALELFAGIGGLSLGLERAGFEVVGHVEIDPYCRRVLARHWPEVPRHDDVRTAVAWWISKPRPRVDLVAGGYPCQTDSLAGKRLGTDDERWLWPEMARVVYAIRPRWVLGENVIGHRTKGLRFVLRDLERLGYAARAGILSAGEVGAPHRRQRIFVLAELADADGVAGNAWRPDQPEQGARGRHSDRGGVARHVADADRARRDTGCGLESAGPPAIGASWWATEPDVGRVAHGVPGRVDRLRGLGNAVVPAVGEHIGRLLLSGRWRDA